MTGVTANLNLPVKELEPNVVIIVNPMRMPGDKRQVVSYTQQSGLSFQRGEDSEARGAARAPERRRRRRSSDRDKLATPAVTVARPLMILNYKPCSTL